jgi:hypothetical protein
MKIIILTAASLIFLLACAQTQVELPPSESAEPERVQAVSDYLDETIIPHIHFDNTPLIDAFKELNELAPLDSPNGYGFSIAVRAPDGATVNLELKEASLRQIINAICKETKCQWRLTPIIRITPMNEPILQKHNDFLRK